MGGYFAKFLKLPHSTKLVLVAGFAYFIVTFLSWQEACLSGFCASRNAWHGFGVLDGLLVIGLLVWEGTELAGERIKLRAPRALVTAALSAALLLFTVIKILDDDEFRAYGSWLGLILSVVIAAGAWLKLQESGFRRRRAG